MKILFNKNTGKRLNDTGKISETPKGPEVTDDFLQQESTRWGITINDIVVHTLHDETDEVLVNDIMQAATVEATFNASMEVDQITIYKIIDTTTDKPEILADGIDTATITATVDDTTSTETIELYRGEILVDSKTAVNGVATFEITMTETGELTLTVKSTTKYGQADVTIEGV
jgi:hypothetical protein